MKNFLKLKSIALVILITGLLTFTLSLNVTAQDSSKTKGKKGVVVLKIKKDNNGKTTVIDTTFTISTSGDHKELEEYLKKHEDELENLGEELDNIEVFVDIPDLSDSMPSDSVIQHLKFIGKDIRSPHIRLKDSHGGFDYDYDFDIPCPRYVSPPSFPGYDGYEGEFFTCPDKRNFQWRNKEQTLSDIIGDIPMDRVKSFSIKDRKNGKRIIVDIEDAPLLEKKEKVIIMSEPGGSQHKCSKSCRQMKVIINSDEDKHIENPTEPPPPPAPEEKQSK
jgi:hypothetical protein